MADEKIFSDRRQALEDAFFRKEEAKKLEAMRQQLAKATRTKWLQLPIPSVGGH